MCTRHPKTSRGRYDDRFVFQTAVPCIADKDPGTLEFFLWLFGALIIWNFHLIYLSEWKYIIDNRSRPNKRCTIFFIHTIIHSIFAEVLRIGYTMHLVTFSIKRNLKFIVKCNFVKYAYKTKLKNAKSAIKVK